MQIKIILTHLKNRIASVIFLLFLIISLWKITTMKKVNNTKFFSVENESHLINNFNNCIFNENNLRYHFQDMLNKRKKFKINYSYVPYFNCSKNRSLEGNAYYIYNSTGMLNITKLEYLYKKNQINLDNSILNNIHISMSFDKNYTDLSLISIASILNTSSENTFIHFHILSLNFGFNEIKKIIDLRKINNRVEFIFYNAKQAEYDFKIGLKDHRGIGNYAKILIPQIINNTDKILILDSGDILCQKDLSELYFFDIGDNYFGWVLDQCAGNYHIIKDKFMSNNFHPNTGVVLVNIKLFKRDNLYKKAIFMSKSYNNFKCPTQDILITIANYKFKYIPLKYNLHIYYRSKEEEVKKYMTNWVNGFLKSQRFSPYRYSKEEIFNAMDDPVIYHFYLMKIQYRKECDKIVIEWLNYAKLVGAYEKLKIKFPFPFSCQKNSIHF